MRKIQKLGEWIAAPTLQSFGSSVKCVKEKVALTRVATIRTYTVYPTTYTRRAMHAMHWQVQKLYHSKTTISLKVAVQLVNFKIYTLLRCVCYRQINSWELTMFLTCVSFVDRWHVLPQTRASRSVVLLDPWPKFARTNLLENCLAKTDGISLFGYSPAQQVWSE